VCYSQKKCQYLSAKLVIVIPLQNIINRCIT